MKRAARDKPELEMTAIAGALSRIGDINKPPLRDALDAIRTRGDRIAALEAAVNGLMEIAELAMPDSFFQSDGRVQAARAALDTPPT